jgi:hypothetical protein
MTITSGLGENFMVDGYDLSGAVGEATRISGSQATLDVPVIAKKGMQRLPGLRDGGIDWKSWFDDTVVHPPLKSLTDADKVATWFFGVALGARTASMTGKHIAYDPTRGQDGSLSLAASVVANKYGLEWGRNLTGDGTDAIASQSSAGALTGVNDVAATTNFGLQVYVHLLSFTGTSITVKVQASDDNGSGDAYTDVTGAATAALTAIGAVRVETGPTAAAEKWLRVLTTGTFSAATFAVAVKRNRSARWY